MNPYEILGVERSADEKTIKATYRKLARKWHPDLFHNEAERKNAEAKMKEINEAFDILKTSEKRAAFDEANPVSANVYEYYANKNPESKNSKNKRKDSKDIEQEKQRRAIIQFLEVEYKHKEEIFSMFSELAEGAFNNTFSNEEYLEYLELVLEEQKDCIANIQKIIAIAKKKQITGLELNINHAEAVVVDLKQKGNSIPRSLKEAHYVEETRRITFKIQNLMKSFAGRFMCIDRFNLLDKTWEFNNDKQLKATCKKHKIQVEKLLEDMDWVQKNASERKITIGCINIYSDNMSIEDFKHEVEEKNKVYSYTLQQLREEFWNKICEYSTDKNGNLILKRVGESYIVGDLKGDFICPPHISKIDSDAFVWARGFTSISLPANIIKDQINLPYDGIMKHIVFNFGAYSRRVDISTIKAEKITRKGKYICISGDWFKPPNFALIDERNVYLYDDKRLCQLNNVKSVGELIKANGLWRSSWSNCELQIHTWAQVVTKLPCPNIMKEIPARTKAIKQWLKLDTTNFDKALLECKDESKTRLFKLYMGLGAHNGKYCHEQAEWLISQMDISDIYRSRLERYPNENVTKKDPMLYVPKEAVDFVEKHITNKEFIRFVYSFLEGYRFFITEAKKAKIELTPDFVIKTAPQYIFHGKVPDLNEFIYELLKIEKSMQNILADKIRWIYKLQRKLNCKANKVIKETVDTSTNSEMRYRYFDIESIECYTTFAKHFKLKKKERRTQSSYYAVEAENVFLSNNSHAIEIIDDKNERHAIVILNLLDEGELFADIIRLKDFGINAIEAIRRALFDQKIVNSSVTGLSIGSNEEPRGKDSGLRNILHYADAEWTEDIKWIKFEYLFENRDLGISYKGYRVRFMVEGHEQKLRYPNPYYNPRLRRGFYMW